MNNLGLVTKMIDPMGGTTAYEYDLLTFQVTKETDAAGSAIESKYDLSGNLVELKTPAGATTSLEYNRYDLVRAIDARGGEWLWSHDGAGHVTAETPPTGHRTLFKWERGLLAERQEPTGSRILFAYNEQNDRVSTRLPNGGVWMYATDNLGRVVQIRNALGGITRMQYDSEGHVLEMENPATAIQHLAYDAEGNVTEVRDQTRSLKLTHARRRIVRREEAGASSEFEWNTEGRLIAVVNERRERYSVVLDGAGREREETGFDGRRRIYLRDVAGRVVKAILPSGRQSDSKYDAMGRLVEVKHSDGTFARFEHDPAGLIVAAENESGRVEIAYDAGWRSVAERVNGHEVRSTYGADGGRAGMTTSLGGRVAVSRGAAGEPTAMFLGPAEDPVRPLDPAIRFEFDVLGMERVRRYSNGIDIEWDRDVAGRTRTRRTFQRPAPDRPLGTPTEAFPRHEIAAQTYQWRGDDQIAAILDPTDGSRYFDHDDRGRLIAERRFGQVIERAMDPAGNVYRTADGGDRQYGEGSRLQVADGSRYEYDEDGNQTLRIDPDGSTWKYAWNGHGALREVERPDGVRIQFEYDAFARRTFKRVVGNDGAMKQETAFVWDGHVVVHEIDSEQGLTTWHWEPDMCAPVAKEKAGRRWTIATDHLGTPIEMHNNRGTLVWKMRLDIFGSPTFPIGSPRDCPWRWPGQYEDIEHGAYYNGTRYYAPDRGSFLSPDPAGLYAGLNLYKYVSDPLTWIDLLGLTGTYMFKWPGTSGDTYIGKGDLDRAKASQSIRAAETGLPKSSISRGAHLDFGSSRMGLLVEAELMRRNNFGTNSNLLNAINSPGEKLLQELEASGSKAAQKELAEVAKNANALEKDFKKSRGEIC
jgi:RHS repeat-associated protein